MILKNAFLVLLAFGVSLVLAQTLGAKGGTTPGTAPDALVKNVTNEVLQVIRSDKDIQAGSNTKAIALIEAKVLPHFDFAHMTQLALGHHWKSADAAQKLQLTDEFHTLLVRTYAKALTEYKDKSIEFKPFKASAGDVDVKIRTQVVQSGGTPIALNYTLEKLASAWKVYDIEVDGISLVTNYRNSFATEVRNGGIAGLIKSLKDKNTAGTSGDKK